MSFARLAPMSAEERARRNRCVAYGCVACMLWGAAAHMPVEYHHLLSAGERAGHRFGIALCRWHHQGDLLPGKSQEEMAELYGPSLKLQAVAFHKAFGSDQQLLDYQDKVLDVPAVVLPTRRRSRGSADSPGNIFPRGGLT